MEGEDSESDNDHAFGKASLPRRMLIVAAGALMNFLVGFLIVLAVIQPNGPNGGYIVSTIDSVDPASTAAAAGGLQAGDEILEVDGYNILLRSDFEMALSRGMDTTYEVVVRRDGEKVTLPAVVLEATIEGEDGRKMIGLTFAEQPDSIGMHVNMAVRTSLNYARLVWVSLGMLVAFISINLGVMNLLPLPALDGGRLVFLIIEGIRRKPVPAKYEGYIHAAGLMLLLALMVYVTGQDIVRIIAGG